MPTYQEGVGLHISDALQSSDVGNTPNPSRKRNQAGTNGRLNGDALTNEGTIYYREADTTDGYLAPDDVSGLAAYFGVVPRSVERWFGIPGPNSQVQYRNCVPLAAIGRRPYTLTQDAPGKSFQRLVLAACLTVQGGLQRTPIFSRGTKESNGKEPYLSDFNFTSLTDALRWTVAMLDGNISVMLQQGWVQVTMEPDGTGGWTVYVYRFYPRPGDASDYSDLPTGGDEDEALGDENE